MVTKTPTATADAFSPGEMVAEGRMTGRPEAAGAGSIPSPHPSSQGETERSDAHVGETARRLFKSFATTARLMVGVPDYDAYVRRRRELHPGEPIMSYEAFFRERQESRYGTNGGKISRCC